MKRDILQGFLTARLFDVRGDDQLVLKLREAGEDVAEVLRRAPQRTAAFTMVAIDAQVDSDEPIIAEVIAKLENRWNSYAGVFSDAQLPVVARAIIFEALSRVVGSDPMALSIALTARNLLPHIGSSTDRGLWAELLIDAEGKLESRARREWAFPSAKTALSESLSVSTAKVSGATINQQWLQGRIEAATGPQNAKGEAGTNPNPHWSNAAANWSYEFAPRMTSAIAGAVDGVAKKLVENINASGASDHIASAVSDYVSAVANSLVQSASGIERRTSLLWWKESLYSPGAKSGYRSMNPLIAAGWLAVDAVDQTGPFAPRMAEAFVVETIRSAHAEATSASTSLREVATAMAGDAEDVALLRQRLDVVGNERGMTPLAGLLAVAPQLEPAEVNRRVGLANNFALTPSDLALWLFRDLQSALANAQPPKLRKSRKKAAK